MNTWLRKFKTFFRLRSSKTTALDLMDLTQDEYTAWWGTFSIAEEQSRYLKVGHIVLCIDHYNDEMRITCRAEHDDNIPVKTFSVKSQGTEFILKPCLPHRPLIVSLERPVFVPSGSRLVLYVSSPTSIQVEVGTPGSVLTEIASEMLSDTWFGTPLTGEICYAGLPACLRTDELIQDTIHITTVVSIVNHDKETLVLDEVKIPLPNLSVYHDSQNHLWTEQILISSEGGLTSTSILKNSTAGLKDLTLLSSARLGVKPRFKGLFGYFGS